MLVNLVKILKQDGPTKNTQNGAVNILLKKIKVGIVDTLTEISKSVNLKQQLMEDNALIHCLMEVIIQSPIISLKDVEVRSKKKESTDQKQSEEEQTDNANDENQTDVKTTSKSNRALAQSLSGPYSVPMQVVGSPPTKQK